MCERERETVNVRVYMLALTRNLEEKREGERAAAGGCWRLFLFVCSQNVKFGGSFLSGSGDEDIADRGGEPMLCGS